MNRSQAIANIKAFNFNGAQLRTAAKGDETWFVASDVCDALGLGNVSLAVNGNPSRPGDTGLDADEKGVCSVKTLGGAQKSLCVSESGLYALIFKSRRTEAKAFRKWVTSEVLPSIRKTGAYLTKHQITREAGKEVFKLQCAELKFTRDVKCLPTKGYHYSNEACMIGRVVLGKWAGADRDTLDAAQLKTLARIEGRNSTYIAQGLDIKLREELLAQYRDDLAKAAALVLIGGVA